MDKTNKKRRAYSVQPVNFYCGRESLYFGNRLNSKTHPPTHTYARIHIHTPHAHTHTRAPAHIHARIYTHTRTLTHTCTHIIIYTYARIYSHTHAYIHTCTYTQARTLTTHTQWHMRAHIHTHVYTFGGYLATAENDTGLTLLWASAYSRPKAANVCLKTHVGVFAESNVTWRLELLHVMYSCQLLV